NALANLTPADFDLTSADPTVTLPARFNKSRRVKVQPLPADVAAALRDYLGGKAAGVPVWAGTWRSKAAEMLRADLEAVGIPAGAGAVPDAVTGCARPRQSAPSGNLRVAEGDSDDAAEAPGIPGAGADSHRPASPRTEWAVPGLNRGPSDFQSDARRTVAST